MVTFLRFLENLTVPYMKQMILISCIAACLSGCESMGLGSEKYAHEVTDANDHDYFVIENKKKPAFVYFTIEGQLSHEARLLWSDRAPDADTVFTGPNQILLPKGNVNMADIRGDYYSHKLYVKYVAMNDSASGHLKIKIKM